MAILISYFCILSVPATLGIIGYKVMESALARNVNQSNFAMLEQAQQLVDSRIKEVSRISLQLAMNANVQWLLNNPASEQELVQLRLIELIKDMRTFNLANDFLDSFFIYLADHGRVVTPTMQTGQDLFFRRIQPFADQDMQRLLTENHNSSFLPLESLESGFPQRQLAHIQSLPVDEDTNLKGSVVILIDERKILSLLERIDWDGESSSFIADKDGRKLAASSNQQYVPEHLRDRLVADHASFEMEKDGNSLLISYTTGENGWKYVTVVPDKVVMKQIHRVKLVFLLLLALGILAGVAISFYLAYRNYRPIGELLRMIQKRSSLQAADRRNEFEIIGSTLVHSFEEGRELQKKLDKQAPLIQSNFISRLIRGNVDIASLDQASLDFMQINLEISSYRVLLIDIEDGPRLKRAETEQELAVVRFIIINLGMELLQGRGYVVELERDRLAILELVRQERDSGEDGWIFELKEQLEARVHKSLTIAVSQLQDKPEHIWKCYFDALLALERRVVVGTNTVIFHEPSSGKGKLYHYPIEFEVLLINYAKTGDYANAANVLAQIYKENFSSGTISPEMSRFLFLDILGSLMKVIYASSAETQFAAVLKDPVAYFAACPTASDMLEQVNRLLQDICASARDERTDQGDRLHNGIRKFVEDHFHDGNLSLTMIADRFHITPQYLSAFFKKYTGKNISDAIAEYRVERAKAMLGDRTLTIGEISRRVGYSNHIGFGRVFKKIEGITPGQYRELQE
ncbi:MAG: AraC family transcriptional regulator [Paenibacillaceae bacterium]|nr:AraC family transcriptional regulator [Paenibacillaceae bacterium]